MRSINIGLIGAGTVGAGVIDSIVENGRLIANRTGILPVLKSVCDKDKNVLENIPNIDGLIKTDDALKVIENKDIDIVVELIGGVHPAKDLVLRAIANKNISLPLIRRFFRNIGRKYSRHLPITECSWDSKPALAAVYP